MCSLSKRNISFHNLGQSLEHVGNEIFTVTQVFRERPPTATSYRPLRRWTPPRAAASGAGAAASARRRRRRSPADCPAPRTPSRLAREPPSRRQHPSTAPAPRRRGGSSGRERRKRKIPRTSSDHEQEAVLCREPRHDPRSQEPPCTEPGPGPRSEACDPPPGEKAQVAERVAEPDQAGEAATEEVARALKQPLCCEVPGPKERSKNTEDTRSAEAVEAQRAGCSSSPSPAHLESPKLPKGPLPHPPRRNALSRKLLVPCRSAPRPCKSARPSCSAGTYRGRNDRKTSIGARRDKLADSNPHDRGWISRTPACESRGRVIQMLRVEFTVFMGVRALAPPSKPSTMTLLATIHFGTSTSPARPDRSLHKTSLSPK